jgi:formylglycine-generating enzyme
MGSPDGLHNVGSNEKPQHQVRISQPFYLGVYEVTRGQFRQFVDDTGYRTEPEKDGKMFLVPDEKMKKKFGQNVRYTWQTPGFDQTDEHPVGNVTWNDAQEFVKWLSRVEKAKFRLPTEAEWEYACRAGSTTRYSFGDDPEGLAKVGNVADATANEQFPNPRAIAARDGYVYTAPVGQYAPNAWGLYDMHGNVWEWCSDGFAADYYRRSPPNDPQGIPGASHRVFRGGGWGSNWEVHQSGRRESGAPDFRDGSVGFRVARDQSTR